MACDHQSKSAGIVTRDTGSIPLASAAAVDIGYHRGAPLLRQINLGIDAGEMIALIGRNGSGKSTLIRSLIGLIPCLEGECFLEGRSVSSIDLRTRAKKVSFVSSRVGELPSITVRELVSLGRMPYTGWRGRLRKRDRNMVESAVGDVGLDHLIDRTMDQLSDGERQRAMIARAFVQDTPLMVLDEPTAYLDLPNKYELIQLLNGFRDQGRAILYSTHDLESALMFADRLWVIQGEEIRYGVPEDLGMAGVFDSLFQTSGITFDVEARRFRQPVRNRGVIRLSGAPATVMAWTRYALERTGFATSEEADVELKVVPRGASHSWILIKEKKETIFQNIEMLVRFLIQDN
jgi:iron complex transport system ATP-binding protein